MCIACRPASAASLPQFAFTIDTSQIAQGIWPDYLAINAAGDIYVRSSPWSIARLRRNGDFLEEWGDAHLFAYINQITVDSGGNVLVADEGNSVLKFDGDGHLLLEWGSYGSGPVQFQSVAGVAANNAGNTPIIYATDMGNERVQIFTSEAIYVGEFGAHGTNAREFTVPGVITIDSSNNLYVIDKLGPDFNRFRVQKFDGNANFLAQWGGNASNSNGIVSVSGIATDPAHNVYVADQANSRVEMFTSDGLFLGQVGAHGSGFGQFDIPTGIAVDRSGNYIYVSDHDNERIQVFAYSALDPIIYQSPTNQTVPVGANVTMSAGVFGAQPMSYQWFFEGNALPGQTNSSLALFDVSLTDSGRYFVVASNALGTAQSTNGFLTVAPLVLTTLSATTNLTGAVIGGSALLGSVPSTVWFDWGRDTNYGNIAGLTNLGPNTTTALQTELTNLTGGYYYRLAGSNSLGTARGGDRWVFVGMTPQVITLPARPIAPDRVLLEAAVNPNGRPTRVFFQWGRSNSPVSDIGAGTTPVVTQYILTNVGVGIYSVSAVASNDMGKTTGNAVRFAAPPWTLLPVPPSHYWRSLATSADGRRLAAVDPNQYYDGAVWLSSDGGFTWTNHLSGQYCGSVTMSADGRRVIAGTAYGIFVSTNYGSTWSQTPSDHYWFSLASSGDGLALASIDPYARQVLTSTNGGLNWRTNLLPVSDQWSAIASSANGRTLVVAAGGLSPGTNGPLFTSTDAGISWTSNNLPKQVWRAVASSADGRTLAAAVGGGLIYVSTNAGSSWLPASVPVTSWQSLSVSADGAKMAALGPPYTDQLFTSANRGSTWEHANAPYAQWRVIVSSADGAKLFASSYTDILSLQTTPAPELESRVAGQGLFLSWVIPSFPLFLQQTSNLKPPQWTDLTNSAALLYTNLHYEVILPVSNSGGFFRLRN